MSTTVKNIFVQVNTAGILANPKDVLANSLIYDQGSMVMGTHVTDFTINFPIGSVINFVIMPLELFSGDMVFFTDFVCTSSPDIKFIITTAEPSVTNPVVSFSVTTQGAVTNDELVNFTLSGVIVYDGGRGTLDFAIDPVLRIKQH